MEHELDSTSSERGGTTPAVTTIIATMAAAERAPQLRRAIASIRAASAAPVHIVVVVNGQRNEAALCGWLRAQPDVELAMQSTPSLPLAILRGRELVRTPYFSTLDDDDEYLPGGLDLRMAAMTGAGRPDVVVTNGYRHAHAADRLTYDSMARVSASPASALFEAAWLQSCNGLFRSDSVGPAYFADYHAYAEWTWLAFMLARHGKRVAAVDLPTYRCHDTPGSLSKSPAYAAAYLELYQRMLAQQPSPEVAALIRRRISAFWHEQSDQALAQGRRLEAAALHWRSLRQPGGLRYLSFTRRLLPGWPAR